MELVTVDSDCAADVDNCVVFAKEPGIHQFPVAANILAILIDSAKEYILVIQSRMLYTKLGKRNFQRPRIYAKRSGGSDSSRSISTSV